MSSEYRARVRVLEDRGDGDAAERLVEVAAALAEDLLRERDPLADFDGHACSPPPMLCGSDPLIIRGRTASVQRDERRSAVIARRRSNRED